MIFNIFGWRKQKNKKAESEKSEHQQNDCLNKLYNFDGIRSRKEREKDYIVSHSNAITPKKKVRLWHT